MVPQNRPKILKPKESKSFSSQPRLSNVANPAPKASNIGQSEQQKRDMTPVVDVDSYGRAPGDLSSQFLVALASHLPGEVAARPDLVESYLDDYTEDALKVFLENPSSLRTLAHDVVDYVRDELTREGYYPDDGGVGAADSVERVEGSVSDDKLSSVRLSLSSGVDSGVNANEVMSTSEQSDEEADTPPSPDDQENSAVRPGSESDESRARPSTGRKRGLHQKEGPDLSQGFFPQEETSTMKRTKKAALDRFISALNNTLSL